MNAAGAWAQRVMHPSAGLTREYVATVDEAPTRKQLAAIAAGAVVDGSFVQPALVEPDISDPSHGGRKLRVIVSEGRNREVRGSWLAVPVVPRDRIREVWVLEHF